MIEQSTAIFMSFGALVIYAAYRSIYSAREAPPKITHTIVIGLLLFSLVLCLLSVAATREAPQPYRIDSYTFDHFYEEFTCYKLFYARYKALTYCTSRPI